jgi:hypothetical protein
MTAVEGLRIAPIKLAHALRQIAIGSLDQQVVVIAHETVGMAEPVKAADHGLQGHQEGGAIGVIPINGLASVAAGGDVVDRARVFDPKGPCHVASLHRWNSRFNGLLPKSSTPTSKNGKIGKHE